MSRRSRQVDLIALSVICAAMALYLVLDRGRPGGPVARQTRLVPEQGRAVLVRLELIRDTGGAVLERDPDSGGYRMVEPVSAPVDTVAVDDLLGTLEMLPVRRPAPGGVATARVELRLVYDDGSDVRLRLGERLPGTRDYRIARGDRVYLVDDYLGAALDRVADDLRSRRPLPVLNRDVTGIEINTGDRALVLSGRPLMVHLDSGGRARADAEAAVNLLERIDGLRLSAFAAAPVPDDRPGLTVTVTGGTGIRRLVDAGVCPEDPRARLVATPVGGGCIDEAALAEIALVTSLGEQLIDRHLLARQRPTRIELAGGLVIESRGGGWARDDDELDAQAVGEWLTEVDALGRGAVIRTAPDADVSQRLVLEYPGGRRDLIELVDGAVRRAGEPIGFQAPTGARALLAPGPVRFRSRQLWSFDPTTVRTIAVRGGVVLTRGQLLEDWSASAGEVDSQVVRQLIELLARPRVAGWLEGATITPRTVIEVSFDAQLGADAGERRSLELGSARGDGCRGRMAGDPAVFVLDGESCALLLGRWTR